MPPISRRRRAALLSWLAAGLLAATIGGRAAASAQPSQITQPGGLRPHQAAEPAAATNDCELSNVTCRPALAGSCTGNTSQSTPPASIKVLVRGTARSVSSSSIQTIPFETYVEDVLPNEWVPSWDGDALKAGAIAVKSYAWYWATHFGGYVGASSACFDVTDDQDFQVYNPHNANARTTRAVQATWAYVARRNGQVLQTSYNAYFSSTTENCGSHANGNVLSQWGSQNCVEANTGNKFNVILATYYSGLQLTTQRQRRTQHDFTFAQRSTPAVYRPSNNRWYIDDGYPTVFAFGTAGDIPAITDSGDGFAHVGVFRPSTGTWYQASATGGVAAKTQWGQSGDVPVAAHYAGQGTPSVLAVFRPSTSTWWVKGSPSAQWGAEGDVPAPGHYTTPNGADTRAVYRPSTGQWWIAGGPTVTWGRPGDEPAPADYTGDGETDFAVYRPSDQRWYVRGQPSVQWGAPGDIPLTGDYTGDGKADLVVYRPSNHRFYVRGGATSTWGVKGDVPIGAAPYHQ